VIVVAWTRSPGGSRLNEEIIPSRFHECKEIVACDGQAYLSFLFAWWPFAGRGMPLWRVRCLAILSKMALSNKTPIRTARPTDGPFRDVATSNSGSHAMWAVTTGSARSCPVQSSWEARRTRTPWCAKSA